jgi:hypothetical protein
MPDVLSVNPLNENCPLLVAVVCDVVVLPLGRVMVAVTPMFGVAPEPVTVNVVLPTVPTPGDTFATSLVAFTLSVIPRESLLPLGSETEHVTVETPPLPGAVHVTLDPVPLIVPADALHAYVSVPLPGYLTMHDKAEVPPGLTVVGLAVNDCICGGTSESKTDIVKF